MNKIISHSTMDMMNSLKEVKKKSMNLYTVSSLYAKNHRIVFTRKLLLYKVHV